MIVQHRMSAADAAWLHMDRRTNRMIVNSLLWLDGEPAAQDIAAALQDRLLARHARFSQRVVDRVTSVWWQDVESLDLREHVHVHHLPSPGTPEDLQRLVSELASRPLNRRRPLWELHLIYGYRESQCVLLSRIHHCIADGIALSRVMAELSDEGAAERQVSAVSGAAPPENPPGLAARAAHVVRRSATLLSPAPAIAVARSTVELFTRRADPTTALHRPTSTQKRLAWSEPIPIEPLLTAARARHGTLNDLFLSAIAGALRTHLAREDGAARDVRAIVPVNLRRPSARTELGNAFGLVFVTLPVSIDDPELRFTEVHRRVTATKASPEAIVSLRLLDLTGHLPYEEEQVLVGSLARKGSLVVTNVTGPRGRLHLAGAPITAMTAYPPESGGLGLGMSLISYGGSIVIGAMADSGVLADPDRLVDDTTA